MKYKTIVITIIFLTLLTIATGASGLYYWRNGDFKADSGTLNNISTKEINIGFVPDLTGLCPNRTLISNSARTINVPLEYSTINEALCQVPIFVRHNFLIYVNALTYSSNENVTVSGIYGFGIGEDTEGSTGKVHLSGMNGYAKVNSIYVSGSSGSDGVILEKFNVSGINPYDDEGSMIVLNGASSVAIRNMTFSGISTEDGGNNSVGILSYGSRVKVNGAHFGTNHTHTAFMTKQSGRIIIRDDDTDGEVTGIAYRAAIGEIYISSVSNIVAPTLTNTDQGYVYNGSNDAFLGSYKFDGSLTVRNFLYAPTIQGTINEFNIKTYSSAGTNLVNIDPNPSNDLEDTNVRLFRNTRTSGTAKFTITKANATGSTTFEVDAKTGNTIIGDGDNQAGITMTNESGSEYCFTITGNIPTATLGEC